MCNSLTLPVGGCHTLTITLPLTETCKTFFFPLDLTEKEEVDDDDDDDDNEEKKQRIIMSSLSGSSVTSGSQTA